MVWTFVMYYFSFLSGMITAIISLCTILSLAFIVLFVVLRAWIQRKKNNANTGDRPRVFTVGFFHPYCNAGGGGERVLWSAIKAIQTKYPDVKCVVYSGDVTCSPQEILDRAKDRFNIILSHNIEFIYLMRRNLVEAWMYPYFTLLGQCVGSILLGTEALTKFVPDVYVDTMGYAFTVPLFRYLGRCKTASYVHYPTISTDMLQRVSERQTAHNNASFISQSVVLSFGKLIYYRLFAAAYGIVGRCNDVVMVNSTWTKRHILQLWKFLDFTFLIYPPCGVDEFLCSSCQVESKSKKIHTIVSVSQFRPEKDHLLQLKAFMLLLQKLGADADGTVRLVLIGSCRNSDDELRVNHLRKECTKMGIGGNVDFKLNISFKELKQSLSDATIGIHTMWNEHFGIGIVESMAAGVIMVAHNSGGPKLDIVTEYEGERTGFLATTALDYANVMETILKMSPDERQIIRENAKKSVVRFTDQIFETNFLMVYDRFLHRHS